MTHTYWVAGERTRSFRFCAVRAVSLSKILLTEESCLPETSRIDSKFQPLYVQLVQTGVWRIPITTGDVTYQ
ncbi:hypothetical protein M413DRAFT_444729 [Hebeloma cylindrosporum]|uniref:Uncharacterized protein n=1 Tax=Hebeloma cylindrosporum TaxID=76867 RepID=A0A0C2YMR1_HEBCY|nr:hypothetical protein M413DRAFT_444729 [Hebeloma cylindrosporum h7]